MSGGGIPLDLILFAALALFLIFRLGSVLGKRTGHQKPIDLFRDRGQSEDGEESRDRSGEREDRADENVIRMPGPQDARAETSPEESPLMRGPAGSGLTQIRVADPDFDPDGFLGGARSAFEMIITAYAEGDGRTLKQLLSQDVYESFAAAIREREKAGHRLEATLYGVDAADIVDAGMLGDRASVTVKFVSQQINVVYDGENRIIEGDPNEPTTVTDIWTFQRDVSSRDPNWELVETRSPDDEESEGGERNGSGGKG